MAEMSYLKPLLYIQVGTNKHMSSNGSLGFGQDCVI